MAQLRQDLEELAEAVLGLAPEMLWSVDEGVARRESKRLFDRCACGDIPPERALTVFMVSMVSKLQHSSEVIESRFGRVLLNFTQEEQSKLTSLAEFFEFFTGVTAEADYATSVEISRKELLPLFVACSLHQLNAQETQDAVFDNMTAKRDTTLDYLQGLVRRLNVQLSEQGFYAKQEQESQG